MADSPTPFDPSRYLTKVSGNDYLEVKWRLLWLRTEHPHAHIETEMTSFDGQCAVFRARVTLPDVVTDEGVLLKKGGSATGWGSEQYSDFRDYLEKAETKALGRALAALGFGTQFCADFDFGAGENRVVDSPINVQSQRDRSAGGDTQARSGQPATPKQLQFISSIARELSLSDESLHLEAQSSFGADIADLNRRDASILIERLQQRVQQSRRSIGASGDLYP